MITLPIWALVLCLLGAIGVAAFIGFLAAIMYIGRGLFQ